MKTFDLGPAYTDGPEGPDRSLLAHCLMLTEFDPPGVAVEFGTGTGDTTRMIADVMRVISFDSFKGLPEDWRPGFPVGHFSDLAEPRDIAGATIVPGWFEHTLPEYDWPENIALVHFDADLYSSTMTALTAVGHMLMPGCILIFDEFFGYEGCEYHEQLAFSEWMLNTGNHDYDVIGHGREQWACRLR